MIAITFAIAIVVLLPGALRERGTWNAIRSNLRIVSAINCWTAIMWISFIYSLRYLPPAVSSGINAASIPLATVLISSFRGSKRLGRFEQLMCVGLITAITLTTLAAVSSDRGASVGIGVGLCLVSGIATAANNATSKALSDRAVTPNQIMTLRFPLLLAAASVLMLADGGQGLNITFPQLSAIALIAIIGVVLPLLALQHAIRALPVVTLGVFIAVGPMVTLGLQTAFGLYRFDLWTGLSLLLIVSVIAASTLYEYQRIKIAREKQLCS